MAKNLINITIQQYFDLQNKLEYDLILDALVQRKEFNGINPRISELSYSEVKFIYKLIPQTNEDPNAICKIYKILYQISDKDFFESSIIELFSTLKEIIDIFKTLKDRELKLLSPAEDSDQAIWEAAGGNSLNPFSNILPLVELGKQFGCYPYDLQNKLYEEILVLLTVSKRQAEVSKEFNRLKTKQK